MSRERSAYLVGAGGVGMSALARLMLEAGWTIEGSDQRDGPRLEALRRLGARIGIGHDPRRLEGHRRVIFTQMVSRRNAELRAARAAGLRMQTRAQALAELLTGREVVAIAGSHGKTTSTAMLTFVLRRAGIDVGHMVGGACASLERVNGRQGSHPIFVLEACEAFGDLDDWRPSHLIVTNLDDEHVEHYGGMEGLRQAFQRLVGRTPEAGAVVLCGDDPGAAALAAERPGGVATYGLDPANTVRATDLELKDAASAFTATQDGVPLGRVTLALPGRHNVRNALGVIAMALRLGAPFEAIATALAEFRGVDRRWQEVGGAAGVRVFDDFAHHPSEVAATLQAARAATGAGGRLVVAFEPQLHARVRRLAHQFAEALALADLVLLAPVEAGGGGPERSPSDELLAEAIGAAGTELVRLSSADQAAPAALERLREGDLLVTMGPGAIHRAGPQVLEALRQGPRLRVTVDAGPSISLGRQVHRPKDLTWPRMVLDRACASPEAPAVECGETAFSYAELMARAAGLADALAASGVAAGDVVAVRLGRSALRPVAFLGILLAGAVYLPLDPGLPRRRANFMLKDARVRAVVAVRGGEPELNDPAIAVILADETPAAANWRERRPGAPGRRRAYVIYTSGTTGQPKGVVIGHAALANFAVSAAEAFELGETSRVSSASAFGFDVAVGETAMALVAGACLVSPSEASGRPGAPLGRFVRAARISHLSLTPSALAALPDLGYPDLTHVIVAGEACPADLAARWGRGRAFFNAYGPTEATVYATVDRHSPGRELTIGRSMDNTSAFILDEAGRPVPRGRTGELWLAGAGLARGYLRRPELTAERFVETSPDGEGKLRAYRTGDLAAMLPDGRIRFLGRADDQIKLRGYRIELGEIEACLRDHPGVADAVVAVRKDASGADRLIAYLVSAEAGRPPDEEAIAAHLGKRLPAYMVPQAFLAIDKVPLSPNGKRDRSALPAPPRLSPRRRGRAKAPGSALERELHALFRQELKIEGEFGVRDTLADLGADSLKTAGLFLAVEARFGVELAPEAVESADTVELLALHVAKAREASEIRADRSLIDDIVRKQQTYLKAWTGARSGPGGLIFTRGEGNGRAPLFWCCQGDEEHAQLSASLGPGVTVYGMRSGHLVFHYSPENVAALAARYADEIEALQPKGALRLGGNCQGGAIAHAVARVLEVRGRRIERLFLLDQGRFAPIQAQVSLIFGDDSPLNPYLSDPDPDRIFGAAYPGGYSVDFLKGAHGAYFDPPAVEALAQIILAQIQQLDTPALAGTG